MILNMWEHNGWGDCVHWSDFESRRISGHLQERLKTDDEIRSKMESGKIARFKVKSVEQMTDPPDQFFATLSYIGYSKEDDVADDNRIHVAEGL